jgi:hypothetical protein
VNDRIAQVTRKAAQQLAAELDLPELRLEVELELSRRDDGRPPDQYDLQLAVSCASLIVSLATMAFLYLHRGPHQRPGAAPPSATRVQVADIGRLISVDIRDAPLAPGLTAADRARIVTVVVGEMIGVSTDPAGPEVDEWSGTRVRLGFTIDVVRYGERSEVERADAQTRLANLVNTAVEEAGIDVARTRQQKMGDCVNVFLPDLDHAQVLPRLLAAFARALRGDNQRYRDQLRLRMAYDIGPVGPGSLGFTGPTIVRTFRLAHSGVLRAFMASQPSAELGVVISDRLHRDFIAAGYPGFPTRLERVDIEEKELREPAWLWSPTNRSG